MRRPATLVPSFALLAVVHVLAAAPAPAQSRAQVDEYLKSRKKGSDLVQASKYDEATTELKHCLEILPNDASAAYDLACITSIRSQLDASVEWLGKAIDWNFGLVTEADVKHLEKDDADLINLRKDARFAGLVDKLKARRKAVAEVVAKPAIYVPAKLEKAESVPLLVVLHDKGETCAAALEKGPWKKIADELGTAVLVPSANFPVDADLSKGMRWFNLWYSYAKAPFEFERGIATGLDVFKKSHKVDPARLFIAGMGQGGMVAFNVAASSNGSYKGAVVYGSSILVDAGTAARAKMAARSGLKVALIEPAGPLYCPTIDAKGADAKAADAEFAALPKFLADCGLAGDGVVQKLDKKADEPDVAFHSISAALKSFLPAPEPPADAEKEGKEEKEKGDKDDDGGGGG
jgi:predicted esterase